MKSSLIVSLVALAFASSAQAEFQYRVPMGMDFSPQAAQESAPIGLSGIQCGIYHCLGVKNGTAWSVGRGDDGRLGLGDVDYRSVWTDTGLPADSVGAGSHHSFAIKDGEVFAVGPNNYGQLGLGYDGGFLKEFVSTGFTASYISGGDRFSLAISNGKVYGAGAQRGTGLPTNSYNFADTGLSAESIAVGTYHSFAINNGNLYVTGEGSYGRMGTGSGTDAPSWVDLGISVDAVSAGHAHSLILKDGTVWSTGEGAYGRTGHGDNGDRTVFTDTGFRASAIISGHVNSYAIQDGVVYSAGATSNSALVLNGEGYTSSEGFKSTGQAADSLEGAGFQFLYIMNDGAVLAGGNGDYGKLGQGAIQDSSVFLEMTQ
ncbi:RCC1 domain-containing protein [Neptuniibacter sp. QD37_11]|uniref:RCC1 domain-containing protein n=1 Tax=Neptuniibacter sp. QD37_11 TaxID=3398209 RepID=UPI0039F47FC8